jgi:hypothetical protein
MLCQAAHDPYGQGSVPWTTLTYRFGLIDR